MDLINRLYDTFQNHDNFLDSVKKALLPIINNCDRLTESKTDNCIKALDTLIFNCDNIFAAYEKPPAILSRNNTFQTTSSHNSYISHDSRSPVGNDSVKHNSNTAAGNRSRKASSSRPPFLMKPPKKAVSIIQKPVLVTMAEIMPEIPELTIKEAENFKEEIAHSNQAKNEMDADIKETSTNIIPSLESFPIKAKLTTMSVGSQNRIISQSSSIIMANFADTLTYIPMDLGLLNNIADKITSFEQKPESS